MVEKILLIGITAVIMYICCFFAMRFTYGCLQENSEEDTAKKTSAASAFVYRNSKYTSLIFAAVWAAVAFFVYDKCYTLIGFAQISVIMFAVFSAAIVDFELRIIPNIISILLLVAGTVVHIIDIALAAVGSSASEAAKEILIFNVIAMLGMALFLVISSKIAHGGMGEGDIKLLSVICYAGGLSFSLMSLSFSLMVGLVFGIVLLVFKVKRFKDDIPFAPFIMAGSIMAVLLGLV